MSRRRSHHSYHSDYDRYNDHHRHREHARPIEYQDDSLSSINSDEESYLSRKSKPTQYSKHVPTTSKSSHPDSKPPNSDANFNNHKEPPAPLPPKDSTNERLGRLESMLEQFLSRSAAASTSQESQIAKHFQPDPDSSEQNRYCLEARQHDFTTSMWINHIEEMAIKNNWNEKSTLQYMVSLMSGLIKAWYNSLSDRNYSWPEWKILITKVFPDNTDFVTTLKRLVTRLKTADESMMNYYFSKMYLIESCKISGVDAVSCLIDGLNNQAIQEDAKMQNFLTPEMLYSQYLLNLPDYAVDYAPAPLANAKTIVEFATESELKEDMKQYNYREVEEAPSLHEDEDQEMEYRKSREEKMPSKRNTVHSRLDKRFIKTPYNPPSKPDMLIPLAAQVCGFCRKRGHLIENCWNKKRANMQCFVPHQLHLSCYYKKCTLNGRQYECLIDTGCSSVVLTESVVKELGLKMDGTRAGCIEAYGGHKVAFLGRVVVDVKVDEGRVEDVEAVVVENRFQKVDAVVGTPFLNSKNVCVLMRNEELRILEYKAKINLSNFIDNVLGVD